MSRSAASDSGRCIHRKSRQREMLAACGEHLPGKLWTRQQSHVFEDGEKTAHIIQRDHRPPIVFKSSVAIYAAASEDGVHFGAWIEIMRVPPFNGKPGDIFTTYPTLLIPDEATQMVTGDEGFLYFARGAWGTNHTAWRRPFKIE